MQAIPTHRVQARSALNHPAPPFMNPIRTPHLASLFRLLFGCALFVTVARAQPLTVNEPSWPMEVLSWNLDKALPGVEYNYRIALRGGLYPYTFALLSGPAGMTIHPRTGEIKWTPPTESTGNTVRVSITDSRAAPLTHSFTVDAARSAFRFVAANGNNTTGDGSEFAPWATMAYANTHAGTGSYIYVKAGTYNETFSINATTCGRFLAYPGDAVTVIGVGAGTSSISVNTGEKFIFQGFTFDATDHRWFFSCSTDYILQNVIWRRNTMHNVYSSDQENPAFIFFTDGTKKPINGEVHYKNIVMQENVFFDLRDPYGHGASATLYNVQDLLFEDNTAYDIDGRGVSDKDDGYQNTFRNNIIHDCGTGITLRNQCTQGTIEIDHNLIYNCGTGIELGTGPGYLRDVFVHHNTVAGDIYFSPIIDTAASTNFNIYRNLLTSNSKKPYGIGPRHVDDLGGTYHYEYPFWFLNADPKVRIDGNLTWTNANAVAGFSYGIPPTSWTSWQAHGYDTHGLLVDPGLNANYALSSNSPYLGIYGRDLAISSPSTYATWRSENFTGADATNDTISGPNADPDAAGLTNYARYAFGMAARGSVANPVTLGTINSGGQNYLTLTFPRRASATDLSYTVESSTDLIIWTAVPGLIYAPGAGPVTAQDIVALGTAGLRRFLRIRIAQP